MASPFQVFRKNQRVLMVVAVGLAMFSFVILSSVQQMDEVPAFLKILMLGMALGFVGWAAGTQQDKKTKKKGASLNFALYGVLIGVAFGVAATYVTGEEPAVYTKEGNISPREFTDLRQRQVMSNQFLSDALRTVRRKYVERAMQGIEPSNVIYGYWKSMVEQDFQDTMNNSMFSFNQGPEMDAVLTWLLNKEADKMGLEVSDEAVNEHINRVTRDLLLPEDFHRIRSDMKLSKAELFDMLRDQIRANLVFNLRIARYFSTPGELGRLHRQLNVRQQIEMAKIPVSEFVKFVPEPKEDELRTFFDEHKQIDPRSVPAHIPSFYRPRMVKVAYLLTAWEKLEKYIDENHPVTDEQIKKEYLDNRDLQYLIPLAKQPEPFPTFPKNENKSQKKDSPDNSNGEKTDKGSENTSFTDGNGDIRFVSFQDAKQKKKSEEKAAKKPKPGKKPAKDTTKEKASQKPSVRVKQPPPPWLPEPPPPTKYQPFDANLKEQIRTTLRNERIEKEMDQRIGAAKKWLKEIVENPYRDVLFEPEKADFDSQKISDMVKKYALEHGFEYTVTNLLTVEEFMEDGKFELSKGTEGFSSANAFNSTPQGNPSVNILFDQILDENYKPEDNLYRVSRSIVRTSRNRYLFWKVEDVLRHVPSLEDDGIREKVVDAWKQIQARELSESEKNDKVERITARQSAEEFAEVVRKSESLMAEALAGKTVSGDADSPLIEILPMSNVFSWIRTTPNIDPGTGRQQQGSTLEVSSISGIETPPGVGYDFMETVFEKLKDGEVGVAFNADKTVYYVVRVLNRTPASESGETELNNRFLKEKIFGTRSDSSGTSYDRIRMDYRAGLQRRWLEEFERGKNIRFNLDRN